MVQPAELDEKQLFSCKRRKRGEPARCRVPDCGTELPSQFHVKYRICELLLAVQPVAWAVGAACYCLANRSLVVEPAEREG